MKNEQGIEQPMVFIVDDDTSLRESLSDLFQSVDLRVKSFASAQEFMQNKPPSTASCLVLDVSRTDCAG